MKRKIVFLIALVLVVAASLVLTSCITIVSDKPVESSNTVDFSTVYAMAEEAGFTGTMDDLIAAFKGDSAYAVAKAAGYMGTTEQWLESLKGAAGKDGVTPTIGENKHWFIGDVDTGVLAEGKDGVTPTIGENKHWFIGDVDTEVLAEGKDGEKGETGNGIEKIEKLGSEGLVDTYEITFTDGSSTTFTVTNGKDAEIPVVDPDAPTADEYFRFKLLADDTYEISARYSDMPIRTVIPSTYNGIDVTVIAASAFEGRTSIDEIVIPASIRRIKSRAFAYCEGMTTVTCAANMQFGIAMDAFEGCTSVETATASSGLCGLIPKDNLKTVVVNSGLLILDKELAGYRALTSVTVTSAVSDIKDEAFKDCDHLTSVTLPNGLKRIGASAFEGCSRLTNITIPDSVKTIGASAFKYCYALLSANIPNELTAIAESTFWDCHLLTEATLPDTLTSIGNNAFRACHSLVTVKIPEGVTEIGENAFTDCYRLIEVQNKSELNIEAGAETYGNVAHYAENVYFKDSDSRLSYSNDFVLYFGGTIPDIRLEIVAYRGSEHFLSINAGLAVIRPYAFYKNEALLNVTLPNDCTTIGEYAFYGCSNLISLTITPSVTTIENEAFTGCDSLLEIINLSALVLEAGSTDCGSVALHARNIITWSSSPYTPKVIWINDTAYYTETTSPKTTYTLVRYYGSATNVRIMPNTVAIADNAFKGCTTVKHIAIPDTITSIGKYAFKGCTSLVSINPVGMASTVISLLLPESITTIGEGAFSGCTAVEAVSLPRKIETLESAIFSGCTSLIKITLHDFLNAIGSYAFYDCSALTSVTIYSKLDSIGEQAFGRCFALEEIDFRESKYDWNRINKTNSGIADTVQIICSDD